MASVVSACNEALALIGARATISSLQDVSPQAQACSLFYTPTVTMILRAAHWGCARRQVRMTELKARYINGAYSPNPPPDPFLFEYVYPPDCLKARFVPNFGHDDNGVSPPLTTGTGMYPSRSGVVRFVPFTVGLDTDLSNSPQRVILTNQCRAQLVYTQDISGNPNLWDPQLYRAIVSTLASFLVNPLARNAALMSQQESVAASLLAAARATDGNEALPSTDHSPDWLRIRASGGGYGGGFGGIGDNNCAGWETATFASGYTY